MVTSQTRRRRFWQWYFRRTAVVVSIACSLACLPAALALQWSEIMFNPLGPDDNLEFIELAGNASLEGCTVADSASSDPLTLLQNGSDVILIVEDDSTLGRGSGAAIYGAGKAIGNGLGNANDALSIACNGSMLLSTSYDAGALEGYKEGMAITYAGGKWIAQPAATPGTLPMRQPAGIPHNESAALPDAEEASACNTTLLLTLGMVNGSPGDLLTFTVISAGYAAWEATVAGELVAAGDTRTAREHALSLPEEGPLKLVATARECGGFQRATRYVDVVPRPVPETPPGNTGSANASPTALPSSLPEMPRGPENASAAVSGPAESPEHVADTPEEPRDEANGRERTAETAVMLDTDRSVIPWVSAFGIVTLIVSTVLFFRLRGEEDAGGKVYKG